jgi:hypothetical protein
MFMYKNLQSPLRGQGLVGQRALELLACVVMSACGGSSGGSGGVSSGVVVGPIDKETTVSNWRLVPATESGLTSYFQTALGSSSAKSSWGGVWAQDVALATASTPGAQASGAPTGNVASFTTLQEAGVDEADLIKSDGAVVYSLTGLKGYSTVFDTVRRDRLDPANNALAPVDTLSSLFSADVRAKGLYLDAERKQLAVLGEGSSYWNMYDAWFAPQSWGQGVTEVTLVDTSSAAQMQKRRNLRISANLIGSRRIGSTLYLVLRSYPSVPGIDPSWPTAKTAANQAILDAVKAPTLLPTLSIDGGASQPLVDASKCFTQPENAVKTADVVTVVGIDLSSTTHLHAARCFTGGTEAFYMSDQSLYLATTRTAYTYDGAFPVYASQTSTDIHKFALSGLNISYRGSGNVTGHLGFDQNRKSFRMGEHQGALRVITQTAPTWGGWFMPAVLPGTVAVTTPAATPAVPESPGHLSILQESVAGLSVVGELPNAKRPQALGKAGEQLYASRFMGSRGYLVTYRLTDPLYVLDLSNPMDPMVTGELQVDGYSDYLFPLTDTLLLGVGKDALSDGSAGDGRFAWYQGVKVSLIDVSNPARPIEAARSVIGRRGTDAAVLHDHHGIAVQTAGNRVRISLPVRLNDTPYQGNTGAANDYYQFTRNELQKFEIDVAARSLKSRTPLVSGLATERDISADRSLLWNEQTHYYQSGVWSSAAW